MDLKRCRRDCGEVGRGVNLGEDVERAVADVDTAIGGFEIFGPAVGKDG